MVRTLLAAVAALITLVAAGLATAGSSARFERTEERALCSHFDPLRQPFFGDLHVHTRYSFDSYISSQRNDPWDAYRYAKGESIMLPDADGAQTVEARLQRPLDFAAITDHSEFLGEINVCTEDSSTLAYWWPHCIMTRSSHFWTQLVAASWWIQLGVVSDSAEKERSFMCVLGDCEAGAASFWQNIQQAAEDHYDRSAECRFTSFVGYEYTDAPRLNNLHRNVIFRNAQVTETAISTYDTGTENFPELWYQLRTQCIEAGEGCDVLAIPHNSNLSGGLMFRDPLDSREASERRFFEPLVELTQHKASSECRFDRLEGRGLDTEDELCDFEQSVADNLAMLGTVEGEVRTERAAPVPLDRFGRRNMARNALKDGLALERKTGLNPFQFGFIGSTDSHSATPGGAEEDNYVGSLGRRDAGYRNVQDHFYDNPGGLAVVWAEENARDSLFEGMRRRETYATSGTRPTLRFFAGWEIEPGLCNDPDAIANAYLRGVPMGGDLRRPRDREDSPGFFVVAMKDPGPPDREGTDLQRIQIVKGWLDAQGETRERVFDVAGDAGNGAHVDPNTCEPVGAGFTRLCNVWRDPDFDPAESAFYYVRVLENPTCRWSTLQCQAAGVNPFSEACESQAEGVTAALQTQGAVGDVYGKCCIDPASEPFYTPVIQERAWSSPIWYTPEGVRRAPAQSSDETDATGASRGEARVEPETGAGDVAALH